MSSPTDHETPNQFEPPTILQAALDLAQWGFYVFALPTRSKRSTLLDSWKNEATTNEATIRAWWERWPDANVAIACAQSGVVVIDIDGETGSESFLRLQREHGALPPTYEVKTPNGRHLFFRPRDGVDLSQRPLSEKVDVRWKGYVVAPPSIHPEGGTYQHANDRPIADLPEQWENLMSRSRSESARPLNLSTEASGTSAYARAALRNELEIMYAAVEGGRNEQLNRSAFSLAQLQAGGQLQAGWEEQIADAAREVGLGEEEIYRTIRSGVSAGLKEPRIPPDHPGGTPEDWTGPSVASMLGRSQTEESKGLRLLRVTNAADVEEIELSWLLTGMMPRSYFGFLEGDPDLGKSTVLLDLVARLTSGRPMPGEIEPVEPLRVLIFNEEHPGLMAKPRLEAAGADLDLIDFFESHIGLDGDEDDADELVALERMFPDIERWIVERGYDLVIFDPLISNTRLELTKYQEAYDLCRPLGRIAGRTGATIIGVRHWTKGVEDAKGAGQGSAGMFAAARFVLQIIENPDELDDSEGGKVLGVEKLNDGRKAQGFRFHLVTSPVNGSASVCWSPIREDRTMQQLIAERKGKRGQSSDRTKTEEAKEVAIEVLWAMPEPRKGMTRKRLKERIAEATGRACSDNMLVAATKDREIFESTRTPGNGRATVFGWNLTEQYQRTRKEETLAANRKTLSSPVLPTAPGMVDQLQPDGEHSSPANTGVVVPEESDSDGWEDV